MFTLFTDHLHRALTAELPGLDAQLAMAPPARQRVMPSPETIANAKQSGVLVLLYPVENVPHLVLMKRVAYPGVHSGQISFPGGRSEEGDHDLVFTALREAEEEVGVEIGKIQVMGQLSQLYIPPSNFLVQPVVGMTSERPDFVPDPGEVDQIIEVPLEYLKNPGIVGNKTVDVRGFKVKSPYYDVFGHTVWGATAMMISEFLTIIHRIEKA